MPCYFTSQWTVTDSTTNNSTWTPISNQATNDTYIFEWITVTNNTPEQIAERDEKERKRKEEYDAMVARARELLVAHLEDDQLVSFEKNGFFLVESSEGNLYQIRTGRSNNVRQVNPETMMPIRSLCAHPIAYVPDYDTMLAQKFMIEYDEPAFVKMANLNHISNPTPIVVEDDQLVAVAA